MLQITNPKLVEMIKEECPPGQDWERFLLRTLKHRRHLQDSMDQLGKKLDEIWPARR